MIDEERKALVDRLRICAKFDRDQADAADQIEADGRWIAELEAALRSIVEPRLGGGEWAASVARQCLTKHLRSNATVDDLELPLRLRNHLGPSSPATIIFDILADKKHPLWGNISHQDERIIREIAEYFEHEPVRTGYAD